MKEGGRSLSTDTFSHLKVFYEKEVFFHQQEDTNRERDLNLPLYNCLTDQLIESTKVKISFQSFNVSIFNTKKQRNTKEFFIFRTD